MLKTSFEVIKNVKILKFEGDWVELSAKFQQKILAELSGQK